MSQPEKLPKKAIRRILSRLAMFITTPSSRSHHLVQENLGNVGPVRFVVTKIPSTFVPIERWKEIEIGLQAGNFPLCLVLSPVHMVCMQASALYLG